jgi:hypothetical protein
MFSFVLFLGIKIDKLSSIPGVPNLGDASPWGDARGLKSVICWVHLYQWGDTTDVRGDADTKRLGTPALFN